MLVKERVSKGRKGVKRRPKKSNPKAKKSRISKVECELCGKEYHVTSIKAHYMVSHKLEVHDGD